MDARIIYLINNHPTYSKDFIGALAHDESEANVNPTEDDIKFLDAVLNGNMQNTAVAASTCQEFNGVK